MERRVIADSLLLRILIYKPLLQGQVAGAASLAEGPRLPFPRPHRPALTGGIPRRSQASVEIESFHRSEWAYLPDEPPQLIPF